MEPLHIRKPAGIRVNWGRVEGLMADAGIGSDAELARRGGTYQSTITRARRGTASPAVIRALKAALPGAPLEDLLIFPDAAAA